MGYVIDYIKSRVESLHYDELTTYLDCVQVVCAVIVSLRPSG